MEKITTYKGAGNMQNKHPNPAQKTDPPKETKQHTAATPEN